MIGERSPRTPLGRRPIRQPPAATVDSAPTIRRSPAGAPADRGEVNRDRDRVGRSAGTSRGRARGPPPPPARLPAGSPPAAVGRSITVLGRRYPVLLPSPRDPRMHVASVVVSVQVLGQVVLGFDVSIAQILLSIATAGRVELAIVAWSRQVIAWPASALLTGNGVALLLRVPGTEHGDWWSLRGLAVLRGRVGHRPAVEVRGPRRRSTALQPVELRAGGGVPGLRIAARRPPGPVVGTHVARHGDHHRRDRGGRGRPWPGASGCSRWPSRSGPPSPPPSWCWPRAATRSWPAGTSGRSRTGTTGGCSWRRPRS